MSDYIFVLKEELSDAYRRYKRDVGINKVGRSETAHQIRQIRRDIRRNSKTERAN